MSALGMLNVLGGKSVLTKMILVKHIIVQGSKVYNTNPATYICDQKATEKNNKRYFRSAKPTYQFAKSQGFSNVWALKIFEHKVLLSVLNSRKNSDHDILS